MINMAVLPPTRFPCRYESGDSDKVAVFALLSVTAGDTVDLSEHLQVVKRGTLVGVTVAAALSASVSGTVVTIPAGASADAAILTVYGVSST
jgi:hypothetical protein